MFQTLRQHPLLVLNQAARDPLDTLAALQDSLYSCIESINTIGYIADPDWEPALQRRLGMSSESQGEGFWPLWSTVVDTLRAQGMAVGPCSFYGWNDGDAGFVRTIWCLIRRLRPVNVVETGVAHGMTSGFILEALETIGAGYQHCCRASAGSICAFTTACTATVTSCSSSNAPGNICPPAASSWSMTSTSIPPSIHSPGPIQNIRRSSAPPSHCVRTRGVSTRKACSVSFASSLRRTPAQSDRHGLRCSPHSTTVGARTNTQFPDTIASIPGACKDAD
jgi:hypothetical protein